MNLVEAHASNCNSKFTKEKWAWLAQFLKHNYLIELIKKKLRNQVYTMASKINTVIINKIKVVQ